jgi:predicted metal-dependent hydrolase
MSLFGPTLSDGDRLEVAGAVIRLKVHSRARRVSLRLDRGRREIIATAPTPRRLSEAAAFARERAGWIAARLAELPIAPVLQPGQIVEVFGQPRTLERSASPRLVESGSIIAARGDGEAYARSVIRHIRREASDVLTELTLAHCDRLGVKRPSITIMDAKGRWGSCRAAYPGKPAAIRYSWRLALAPLEVADYVAAHECAHLLELNHGPKFWAHVASLVGDPARHRTWLKTNGPRLHAFGT